MSIERDNRHRTRSSAGRAESRLAAEAVEATQANTAAEGTGSQDGSLALVPVSNPVFMASFLGEHLDELALEARRVCRRYDIIDFAEDALSAALEKFMSSRVVDRGPRSAIAFAVTVVRNTCIDEVRRRSRQAILAGAMTGDLGEEDGRAWVPEPASGLNPERALVAGFELHAVSLGFEHLPTVMAATHRNVARDLDIVQQRYVEHLSWEQIAKAMRVDKAHRQSGARGRELLRGWVHALCGTQPEPDAVNRKYWRRGFDAGERFRGESDDWPPRGHAWKPETTS